jgi:glycosyltransferase involved in cell wall biosynthesis
MKIGFVHQGYPEVRNILSTRHQEFTHKRVTDIFKILDHLHFKMYYQTKLWYHNTFDDRFSVGKVDLYHFFNGVNMGNKPWVSSFETFLPRYGTDKKHTLLALEKIVGRACKKIIPFSDFNHRFYLDFLQSSYPDFVSEIQNKMEVVLPPQRPMVDVFDKNLNDETFRVLLVGHYFFSKGGREVFRAVERLHREGYRIEFTIVSKILADSLITFTTKEDEEKWKKILGESPFCRHFSIKDNTEVFEIMKKNHVLLIPSTQETFGYVVLEAQACATPVITTSIRAFPEINNNDCGFVINIPQDSNGTAAVSTHGYESISQMVEEGVYSALKSMAENRSLIEQKGTKALERINKHHAPKVFSEKLYGIYSKALQDY